MNKKEELQKEIKELRERAFVLSEDVQLAEKTKEIVRLKEIIEKAIDEIKYWCAMAFLKNDLNDHDFMRIKKDTDKFISDLEKLIEVKKEKE